MHRDCGLVAQRTLRCRRGLFGGGTTAYVNAKVHLPAAKEHQGTDGSDLKKLSFFSTSLMASSTWVLGHFFAFIFTLPAVCRGRFLPCLATTSSAQKLWCSRWPIQGRHLRSHCFETRLSIPSVPDYRYAPDDHSHIRDELHQRHGTVGRIAFPLGSALQITVGRGPSELRADAHIHFSRRQRWASNMVSFERGKPAARLPETEIRGAQDMNFTAEDPAFDRR